MSVSRIRRERDLAEWIGNEIDKYRQDRAWWRERSPRQVLDRIRADVWDAASDLGDTKWAFVEEPAPACRATRRTPGTIPVQHPQSPGAESARVISTRCSGPSMLRSPSRGSFSRRPHGAKSRQPTIMWSITVITGLLAVVGIGIGTVVCLLRRREEENIVDDRMPPSDQVALLMRKEKLRARRADHMTTIRDWSRAGCDA